MSGVRLPKPEHYVIAAEHSLAAAQAVPEEGSEKLYQYHVDAATVQAQLSTTAALLAVRDELVEIKNLLLAKAVDDEREP